MTEHPDPFVPRLVATDVDGTIVPHFAGISDRTRTALHACAEAGIEVVLVTGRPPRWLQPVVDALGFPCIAICANGGIVVDTSDFSILDITTVPAPTLAEMVRRLEQAVPDAVFAAESPTVLRAGPGYEDVPGEGLQAEGLVPANRLETILPTGSVEEMLDGEIYKLVVESHVLGPDELLEITRDAVGDLAAVTRSVAGRSLVEMGSHGMSKATVLDRVVRSRGIDPSEVVAFGDMPNDVAMLTWAGQGYAMEGSHPEAIAAAGFMAPPADDDGVARVLEGLLPHLWSPSGRTST